jgi:hypothetical protein
MSTTPALNQFTLTLVITTYFSASDRVTFR